MRILVYGINYEPELTGIGKYTGEMCTWLSEKGHEVRVISAPPYYPRWQVAADYLPNKYRVEKFAQNLTVFRIPTWVPSAPNGWKRMLHLLSFSVASIPILLYQLRWQPAVVINIVPTGFSTTGACALGLFTNSATWLHIQDFEIDAAFELGLLPANSALQKIAFGLERFLMSRFDRVSTISSKMIERLRSKGVAAEKLCLFPNWVDTDGIFPCNGSSDLRDKLGLQEKIVVLYSGNLGQKQGLEILAPLARAVSHDARIHFVFCGGGSYLPKLEQEVKGANNVTLLPLQPLDRLNELLSLADIHLLPQKAGAADLVMPSKLTGMLSSGRPIVAGASLGTQVYEVVSGRGITVAPENIDEFQKAVEMLAGDESLRLKLGIAAREYATEQLNRERILRRFEKAVREATEQRLGGNENGGRREA